MRLILLSGGSGRRLWPLSNDSRSKQFLNVLDNGNGQYESMIQRIWRQLRISGLSQHSYVVANSAQTDILRSQLLNEVPIIAEPARKDTFPAIALAVLYLIDVVLMDPQEAICVMPVDSYVEDLFFCKFKELEQALISHDVDLALVGAKPTYPSAKYGYIIPGSQDGTLYSVDRFVEKPTEAAAADLIRQEALWNCGIFAFRGLYLKKCLHRLGLPSTYFEFHAAYMGLQSISFDYAVAERAHRMVVVPYDGDWKDLGTWNTLTEEIPDSIMGKGAMSDDCVNTHIFNELNLPVKVLGISNAVVAVSPDGILVTDKSASPRLKEVLDSGKARDMYAERLWGWYSVLDEAVRDERIVVTRKLRIYTQQEYDEDVNGEYSEVLTVVSGNAILTLDGVSTNIQPGDALHLRPTSSRVIRALSDVEFLQIQMYSKGVVESVAP